MIKQFKHMEQSSGSRAAAFIGIIGGMVRYIHLITIGDVMAINKLVEPAITAAICGFMGVLGKQLYKWSVQVLKLHISPWVKTFFKSKK
jgi:LytS/YehU family sensor histidine kinase